MLCFKVLLYHLSMLASLNAKKILAVFPTPSFSHQVVFRPLTEELARRGHEVVVITTDPAFPKGQSPANLTEIDVHDVSYSIWSKEFKNIAVEKDPEIQLYLFSHLLLDVLEQQIHTKEVRSFIRNKTFNCDLILAEALVRPALIYSHIFKAPVIQVSSLGKVLGTNALIGAPMHPLYQPIPSRQRYYDLTLWERIHGIYITLKLEYINYKFSHKENFILKRIFGPDTPDVYELVNNVDMVFLNVHPIWDNNAPVPPGVIYIGGIHEQPAQTLPKKVLTYLDSSRNGIIYLSFGTNVHPSILPPQSIKVMMKVFSQLPYDVIWRWDKDIPDKPSNVKMFKWLPQPELLRHPKLKLFITQGGLQSTDEAIAGGVPLIGIPVLGDQWYNVEKYAVLGIGLQLEIGVFTEKELKNAIFTVIENQSYRQNILRLRALMRDQPQRPLERAIWWTEYVLRHGGARHLRSPAANMSWAEYYELKLVFIVLACVFTTIAVLTWVLHQLYKYVFRNNLTEVKLKLR